MKSEALALVRENQISDFDGERGGLASAKTKVMRLYNCIKGKDE